MLNESGNTTTTAAVPITVVHKVVFLGMWAAATLLNFLNCIIMGRTTYMKRNWPNILVFALAMADLCVLVTGLIPAVVAAFLPDLLYENPPLCYMQAILLDSWMVYSFVLVVYIGLDRYLAVCHPFHYSRRILGSGSLKRITISLFLLAVFAVFLAFMPATLGWQYRVIYPGLYCFFDWTSSGTMTIIITVINFMFVFILLAVLLYFTICICSGIFKMLQISRQRVVGIPNCRSHCRPVYKRMEMHFANLAVIIIVVFAGCSLPFAILLIVNLATTFTIDPHIDYAVFTVLLLNSAINPILHVAVRKPVREAYVQILRWFFYVILCCCDALKPTRTFDDVLGVSKRPTVRIPVQVLQARQSITQPDEMPVPIAEPHPSSEADVDCSDSKDSQGVQLNSLESSVPITEQSLGMVSSQLWTTANSTFTFHRPSGSTNACKETGI